MKRVSGCTSRARLLFLSESRLLPAFSRRRRKAFAALHPVASGRLPHWIIRPVRPILVATLLLSLLAACADDDSERRFANDPIPTEDIAAQPTTPSETDLPTSTVPPVSPVAPDQLLADTGPTPRLFATAGSRVLALPVDGSAPTEVFDAGDRAIEALAGSTDGQRVALITADQSGRVELVIIEATGESLTNVLLDPVAAGASTGTPPAAPFAVFSLAWSPAGDRVLVGHRAGGILEVNVAGATRVLLGADAAPSPRGVTWSPSGEAVAYVDAGPTGNATGLFVASTDVLPIDPVAVVRPIEGQSRQITEIAWPPGDVGLIYSERSPNGDLSVGGDLFSVSPSGGRPQLIGSARTVAQVGAVDVFAASPNGTAVAFSVVVAGEHGAVSGGLVVKQIAGPTVVELPAADHDARRITALDWTVAGLAWAAQEPESDSSAGLTVNRALPDGSTSVIFAEAAPGTPAASPRAEPAASPRAEAIASPETSPVASVRTD